MKFFVIAALLAVAAAAPSSYPTKYSDIVITAQSDVRNLDGSGAFSYSGSDGTTRDESYAQKGVGYEAGNTDKGSAYWISPEGERITITWVADEGGYRAVGDHLPTPPPIPAEIAAVLPTLPKLEPYGKY